MPDPLASITRRQHRDLRTLYTMTAEAIQNAIARQLADRDPNEPISSADRSAIMREVDAALDIIWGEFYGDPDGAIRTMVLRDAPAARAVAMNDVVKAWGCALPRDLRGLIDADAKDGA